jgi:glucose/arabinose dehydrogenase
MAFFFFIFSGLQAVTTRRIATGFSRPLFAVSPAGDGQRLFVLEQHTGKIRILNLLTHQINAVDFLAITSLATGSEQGLLGLAFDPDYADNGFFYVNVTIAATGTTQIRRYQVSANPDIADVGSQTLILTYSQPQTNHNGGWMGFGPDGYLYIASGDGGGGDDDDAGHTVGLGNGQDTTVLLGKLLRIDVHGDDFPGDVNKNYSIPPDNPFVGIAGADEIWAYGLRNPWRCSFDRQTGDLYIADVGQGVQEEINFQPAASSGGENYGWRVMEGTLCHNGTDPLPCNDASFTSPIHVYNHVGAPNGGNSITGGYVYRGPRQDLQGTYFFADYVSAQIWTFKYDGVNKTDFTNRTTQMLPDVGSIANISSFGQDDMGNLYVMDLTDGEVFKILPEPVIAGDYDGDGFINMTDLGWMAKVWLKGGCNWCGGFDFDTDQDVDVNDLQAFAALWLQ